MTIGMVTVLPNAQLTLHKMEESGVQHVRTQPLAELLFVLNANGQVKKAIRSKQSMMHISNPKGMSKLSKSRLYPTSLLRTPMAPPTTPQMA